MDSNNVYLPQFKGESNPYDELWYLSLEIGRALMFRVERIDSEFKINDGVENLLEKHDYLVETIKRLTPEEREFLHKDSYFGTNALMYSANDKIISMEKESCSKMSCISQLVSKDFLIATMGKEDGTKEYKRRSKLYSVATRYNDKFLYDVIEWLNNKYDNEGIEKFITDNFESTPTVEDIQLMIDIRDTGYKYYSEQ